MRLLKSLPYAISALALAAGTAFAGGAWLSEQYPGPQSSESMAEADVIYIYPVEVTEYWLLVPSESSEMPG